MKRIEIAAFVLLQLFAGLAHAASLPRVEAVVHGLPLAFEANAGQFDKQVSFLARGRGKNLFLTVEGMVLTLGGGAGGRPPTVRPPSSASTDPTSSSLVHSFSGSPSSPIGGQVLGGF